jgi:hypothetical protein
MFFLEGSFNLILKSDYGISKPSNSSHFHKKKIISYSIED